MQEVEHGKAESTVSLHPETDADAEENLRVPRRPLDESDANSDQDAFLKEFRCDVGVSFV